MSMASRLRYAPDLILTRKMRIAKYGPVIKTMFESYGLPVSWGMAFAQQETTFRPWLDNLVDPGDKARGGSYGMFQMSLQTARQDLNFTLPVEDLYDVRCNASMAAKFIKRLFARYGNLTDTASHYNAGRALAKVPEFLTDKHGQFILDKQGNKVPHPTRATYVPNILASVEGEFKLYGI